MNYQKKYERSKRIVKELQQQIEQLTIENQRLNSTIAQFSPDYLSEIDKVRANLNVAVSQVKDLKNGYNTCKEDILRLKNNYQAEMDQLLKEISASDKGEF